MRYSALLLQLALGVLAFVSFSEAEVSKDKRQVGKSVAGTLDTEEDRETAATAFASAGLGSSKYFQDFYQVQLSPDKLEFGHVCETPKDWEQRFERKDFKENRHQGKVRWGDKHGGYGEHYWDYNHAGHGGDGGEETQQEPQYAEYTGSSSEDKHKYVAANGNSGRAKRQPTNPDAEVEFIDETAKFFADVGLTGKHGGNYRWEPSAERAKRTPAEISDFTYDPNTGRVIDEKTGRSYTLTPVVA